MKEDTVGAVCGGEVAKSRLGWMEHLDSTWAQRGDAGALQQQTSSSKRGGGRAAPCSPNSGGPSRRYNQTLHVLCNKLYIRSSGISPHCLSYQ